MDCSKCHSTEYSKDGKAKGRQRYLCKKCQYHYTVTQRAGTGTSAVKRQALQLYLEGLGFRSISRILDFSNVTILNWIRSFGEQLDSIRNNNPAEVMELDEMHTYIGSKKTIAGYGLLLIEMKQNISISHWAPEELPQGKISGIQ